MVFGECIWASLGILVSVFMLVCNLGRYFNILAYGFLMNLVVSSYFVLLNSSIDTRSFVKPWSLRNAQGANKQLKLIPVGVPIHMREALHPSPET